MRNIQQDQLRGAITFTFRTFIAIAFSLIGYFGNRAMLKLESIDYSITSLRIEQARTMQTLDEYGRRINTLERYIRRGSGTKIEDMD